MARGPSSHPSNRFFSLGPHHSQEPGLLQNCSGGALSLLQRFKGEVVLRSFFFFLQLKPVCFCFLPFLGIVFTILHQYNLEEKIINLNNSRREALFTASGALCLQAMQMGPPAQNRGTLVLRSLILRSLTEMTHLRGQDPDAGED